MTEQNQVMQVVNNRQNVPVLTGVVTHYVDGEGAEYGFISYDGDFAPHIEQRSVFFHHNYQRTFGCNGGNLPVVVNNWNAQLPYAENDCEVVFEIEEALHPKNGMPCLRAKFWGHKDSYDKALAEIAQRYTYRLRKRTGQVATSKLKTKPDYETLWVGKDMMELRKLFPIRTNPIYDRGESAVYFEYKERDANGVEVDSWKECGDPREVTRR